jgi:hypothetical protein
MFVRHTHAVVRAQNVSSHFTLLDVCGAEPGRQSATSARAVARPAISETLPWTFASPDARGLGLFLFWRRVNNTTTSHYTHSRKDYRKMAHLSGPPMSYSSMKGRLHDGLLKGLEVMGYE